MWARNQTSTEATIMETKKNNDDAIDDNEIIVSYTL